MYPVGALYVNTADGAVGGVNVGTLELYVVNKVEAVVNLSKEIAD